MKFVDLFLTLPKTIIIGWTSSIGKYTITSNTDKQGKIGHFTDLFIAIGGGIGATNTFIGDLSKEYINLLISKWDEPSQKFVNSIGVSVASSPIVSTPAPSLSPAPAPGPTPSPGPVPSPAPVAPTPSTATILLSENSLVEGKYITEFLGLGVPKGYVVVSQDRYIFFKQSDDKTKMKDYTINSLKLEDFTFSETGIYVHSVFAGSFLFYYDFKKVGGIDYYKVWFPFNGSSAFSGSVEKNNYNDVFKINTFNPQGNGGMLMWLPVPMMTIHEFDTKEKKEIEKTIDECRKNPDKIYKDAVIMVMINFFDTYTRGGVELKPKMKNLIKKIFPKIQIKLPDNFDSYPSFYSDTSITPDKTSALKKIIEDLEKLAKGETPAPAPITSTSTTTTTSSPSGVSQVRELSVDQINSQISNPSNNSIYIINGGSFNPPHFGHIGLFEIAYQAIASNPTITKTPGQKYYGVMVLAPKGHIKSKLSQPELKKNGVLSLNARIKLCKLTIDDYPWKNPSQFGPQNMIVVNEEDYNPMGSIIGSNPSKIQNMYYLCGSDFYFDQKDSTGNIKRGHYAAPMNMIYSIRDSSLGATPEPYTGSFKRVRITDSEYQNMSSTKVRQNILTLEDKAGFNLSTAQEIIRNIGKGSYCYLGSMPYLIPKNNYHLQEMGCPEAQSGGGSNTNKRTTLKNRKPKSRKIKKHAVRSISTTRFTKKKHHLKHSNNKKHKTRRNKH